MRPSDYSLVRFPHNGGKQGRSLPPPALDHRAVVEGTTIYRKGVQAPGDAPLLKSGHNNSKIGKMVVKGAWAGFPIFVLTLEERATCPRSCLQWQNCYGNNMPFARRWEHGEALETKLFHEIVAMQQRYPKGFVVRLHVLCDFYSVDYVGLWRTLLDCCPALHVFGYTARIDDGDPIVGALAAVRAAHPSRWFIRGSGSGAPAMATEVVDRAENASDGAIVCPQQQGKTLACATCALCWATTRNIAFLRH